MAAVLEGSMKRRGHVGWGCWQWSWFLCSENAFSVVLTGRPYAALVSRHSAAVLIISLRDFSQHQSTVHDTDGKCGSTRHEHHSSNHNTNDKKPIQFPCSERRHYNTIALGLSIPVDMLRHTHDPDQELSGISLLRR